MEINEKKCPFCAESIKKEAVICRFCQRDQPSSPNDIAQIDPSKLLNNAITLGDLVEVKRLLQGSIDVTKPDKTGLTPLSCARQNDRHEISAILQCHPSYTSGQIDTTKRVTANSVSNVKSSIFDVSKANPNMICPHCQSKGGVRTKSISQKMGVSGGKATAALLTGGLSLFAVGLSRKQKSTEAKCTLCKSVWFF